MSNMVIGEDGWVSIEGEQTRGGQMVLGDEYQMLGEELSTKSPAFRAYAEKRLAATRPILRSQPYQKARDWQIDFGPVTFTAAGVTTITVAPQCLFRAEKVMATDSGNTTSGLAPGYATRIQSIFVGQKSQRPANTGSTLTAFFANNSLGNGVKWDTCDKALSISITVQAAATCTFDMTVFGKAVL